MTSASVGTRHHPLMIAVSGPSGSGKSTLSRELARSLGGLHFSLDHYYRDLSHLPHAQRAASNFDDPAMLEVDLLATQLAALARGEAIQRPVYDFATHSRVPGASETISPMPVIFVEGLFSYAYASVRPIYHFSIHVDAPDALCFERRLRRDVEERGRTPESVRRQYDATVRPCGLAFVRPLAELTDILIDGGDPLDFKVEQVIAALRRRGLLRSSQGSAIPLSDCAPPPDRAGS